MTALANKETIERLYAAFAARNGHAVTACYAPGAHFEDPAFGKLEGDDIGAMWRMLTGRARDLEITLRGHEADERAGTAPWLPPRGRYLPPRLRLRLPQVGKPGARPQRPSRCPVAAAASQSPGPGARPA